MAWWVWLIIGIFVIGIFGNNKEKKEKQKKLEEQKEILKRRKEAEDYIMSSGDPEAIKMLMLARANPANYRQVLSGGMNKGNSTLKTALGVMTGVVAGNLVTGAIASNAISSALEDTQAELSELDIESFGGDEFADASIIDTGDDGSLFDLFD